MFKTRLEKMGQVFSKRLNTCRLLLLLRPSSLDRIPLIEHRLVTAAVFVFLLFFYVGVPIWFYFCPWIRRHAVFLHKIDWPFQDFAHPEVYGMVCTRNFYVETATGVTLGVWHVLPASLRHLYTRNDSLARYSFQNDDRPVVLYLHGSAESRSAAYRRSMYRVLSSPPLDFHVVTFDYRGFGDSTDAIPNSTTVVEDAEDMYRWLKTQVPLSRIYVWGHSLGSGVAIRLGEITSARGDDPLAIVLEAPFTSVADATLTFPLSFFHRRLPYFKTFCSERTRMEETNFDSDVRVGNVTAPLLVLHAADDSMVLPEHGKTLWRKSLERRPSETNKTAYVELDGKYGCGHRNIHRAPELPNAILEFIQTGVLAR